MAREKKTLLLIDGNALLHRAWHAIPPLTAPDGKLVNAAFGFISILFKALKEVNPTHAAVTFDRPEPTFRHKAYAEYKATRVKQPDELYEQIPVLREILDALAIPIYDLRGFEADDVIATVAEKTKKVGALTVILTGDMDTLQLVDSTTTVMAPKRGIADTILYDETAVKERYGLTPDQMVDYKSLRGDPSDNIPGVKGVGEKTATELLKTYGTVEGIYKELDRKSSKIVGAVAERLRAGEKDVKSAHDLVILRRDAPVKFNLDDAETRPFDREKLMPVFAKYGFRTLLDRIASADETPKLSFHGKLSFKRIVPAGSPAAVIYDANLAGFAIATTAGTGIVKTEDARAFLENPRIEKITHDAKALVKACAALGIRIENIVMDTMLASYLLNPGTRGHDLERLIFENFGKELRPIEAPQGRLLPPSHDELAPLYAERASFLLSLSQNLGVRLQEQGNDRLLREIELPLVPVLAEMETNGVLVDTDFLKGLSKTHTKRVEVLSEKIYKLAGEEFNISSPAQLKTILFEKLKISTKGVRKTATGADLSTAAAELEKLRGAHPIVEFIFEYRELQKLLTTYVDALPLLVNPKTGRVHTTYNQTVAATGRLSSSDPNLQNIPVRTETGREIRKAFVAPRGSVLLAADYSQIELRLVAAIAGDKKMLDAFRRGADIHTQTAADIWSIPEEKITKDQRRAAKAVNFGIIYGQGPRGLAESADISFDEARDFIDRYFLAYPSIREYLDSTKALAASQGFVETIFGRRRYLPDITSGVPQVRAAAERAAINMPIQGSAADLIKIAMVRVHEVLQRNHPDVKLILQVHDELVFECPTDAVPTISRTIKEIMENVHKLTVPIVVDLEAGKNWGELKSL